jgi:hypothetical protein
MRSLKLAFCHDFRFELRTNEDTNQGRDFRF